MICYKCGKLGHVEDYCIQSHSNDEVMIDKVNYHLNDVQGAILNQQPSSVMEQLGLGCWLRNQLEREYQDKTKTIQIENLKKLAKRSTETKFPQNYHPIILL